MTRGGSWCDGGGVDRASTQCLHCNRISKVTTSDREALSDCEVALELLESVHDERQRRVIWFGAVTLLRTVGDVLHRVDGIKPRLTAPIAAAYKRWKINKDANLIYWDFIKDQRDALVHEYEFRVDNNETIKVAVQSPEGSVTLGDLPDNLFRPIVTGYGVGEDARDIYQEAIDWWNRELTAIEEATSGP